MGKKNKDPNINILGKPAYLLLGRKVPTKDQELFCNSFRKPTCLYRPSWHLLEIRKLNPQKIKTALAFGCNSIEHQILKLRELTQLSQEDYKKRLAFTKNFLTCLQDHHEVIYQGILFGSTVNGLGFCDSDVDLRLRPLQMIGSDLYEPYAFDEDRVDKTLKNIAHMTTKCSPALGEFVPSTRCPVAKLTFVREPKITNFSQFPEKSQWHNLEECLKYDISLGSETPLGTFNSMFLRFLCNLQPKFHLLATVLRYWSTVHELIVPGYLSSYALINMLIFFLQSTQPPLLPTLDEMRDLYFKKHDKVYQSFESSDNKKTETENDDFNSKNGFPRALTQIEWQCIVCLDKSFYEPSKNNEPLGVLLLKFFEFYLKFPYSSHIITTRPGRALTHDEFKNSSQYHPRYPINQFLSIQDPFDTKHNLTSGMQACHFKLMIITMKKSYEIMYEELMKQFFQPQYELRTIKIYEKLDYDNMTQKEQQLAFRDEDHRTWGLNCLFIKLKNEKIKQPQLESNKKVKDKDKQNDILSVSSKKNEPSIKM